MIGQACQWVDQGHLLHTEQLRLFDLIKLALVPAHQLPEHGEQEEADGKHQRGQCNEETLCAVKISQALGGYLVVCVCLRGCLLINVIRERVDEGSIEGEGTSRVVCINEGQKSVSEEQVVGLFLLHGPHKGTIARIAIPYHCLKNGAQLLGRGTKFSLALGTGAKGVLIEDRILGVGKIVCLLIQIVHMNRLAGASGGLPDEDGCPDRTNGEGKQDRNESRCGQISSKVCVFHQQVRFLCDSREHGTGKKCRCPAENNRPMEVAYHPPIVLISSTCPCSQAIQAYCH